MSELKKGSAAWSWLVN